MRFLVGLVAAGLVAGAAPGRAAEHVSDLLGWVPAQTNLALFVDAEFVRESEVAKKEMWGSDDAASGLDSLPAGVSRFVVASHFDPGSGPSWEVLVAGLRKPITDADLLKGTGGTLDSIADRNVVLTHKKHFAVNLAKGVVGAYQPPNRQDVGRWLRAADSKVSPRLAPHLTQAGGKVTEKTPVVLAIDATDMFDPTLVRMALAKSETLKGKNAKIRAVADLFGQMRGITFSIQMTNALKGELTLTFSGAPTDLADVAKPLLLEIIERLGVRSKEMDGWAVATGQNTLTFGGPLSTDAARDILAPFIRPWVSSVDQTDPAASNPDAKAQASLKYFKAVHKKMAEAQASKNPTFAKMATTFNTAARYIDDLPILNVDDELLDWGASVATTFRTMAIVAQTTNGTLTLADANRQMVSVSTPNYYTGYAGGYAAGYYGGYGWGYNYAVPSGTTSTVTVNNYGAVGNVMITTKTAEYEYRQKTWKAMESATSDVRRKMVKKYDTEF